ncbi:MAG: hypothetical protein KGS72_19040 [Cyanobacteria bacterium REEB67]|nr:hypothetical protein [Cyanobacteria bacterium REEB67]
MSEHHGNEELKPEVQKAVQAGSDLSKGSDQAYNALMNEVSQAQAKYGNDTAGFDKYGNAVARGLEKSGTLEEMSEQFAKHNIREIATSDEKHIKAADLNPQFGTNALEKAFLSSLQSNYGDLQQRAGTTFWGNQKNEFSEKDLNKVLESRQAERDTVENQRLAQEQQAREQAKFDHVTSDLFKNDGDPNHSLYSVLDGIKSGAGDTDGKISHGDLKRYQEDYAVRAARGDFGFNKENLDTVRTLDREWDGKLGVALRGTSPRQGGYNNGEDEQTNYSINLKAASEAMNRPVDQLFASYAPQGAQAGRMTRVDADNPAPTSAAPLPDVGPIPDQPAIPGALRAQAPGAGDRVAAQAAAPPADPVLQANARFDAQGNPIGATGRVADSAAPPPAPYQGDGASVVGPNGQVLHRRPLGADNRPLPPAAPANDASDQYGPAQRRAPGSAYDDYYGSGGANGAGSPGPAGGERVHRRAPAPGDNGAGPAPSDASAPPAAPYRRLERAAAGPDLSTAPELKMPELKAGDDPKKVAADFQKAAMEHFTALSRYTVQPGQGWDRIARDAMRKTGQDISSEANVEKLSDQLAKLNGAGGRLDRSLMLHPNDVVKLHDDAWVKAQVEQAMTEFNKKVTDATGPSGAAAAPGSDTPDLYSGDRNGEGDITPPAAPPAGKDQPAAAAPPAGKDQPAAAAPPAGQDQPAAAAPPAGKDQPAAAAAPPPPGADQAVIAPPGSDTSAAKTPAQIEAEADAKRRAAAAAKAPTPAPTAAAAPPAPGTAQASGNDGLPNIYGNPL